MGDFHRRTTLADLIAEKTMFKFEELIRGAPKIACPDCGNVAIRQGTQDLCDVYLCPNNHVTRIKLGSPRNVLD